jgi:hypothetical protein
MEERIEWLRSDFKIMLLGPDGEHDALGKWLLSTNALLARPHVIFNHLAVFSKLDEVLGVPDEHRQVVPFTFDAIRAAIEVNGNLAEDLVRQARRASSE